MMNRRLQETIKQRASEQGWELDSTFDSTRVLRVVDTYNRKDPDNPILVELIENSGIRYGDISDFDDHVIAEDQLRQSPAVAEKLKTSIAKNFFLHPNDVVPDERIQELLDIEPKVALTIEGQKTDLDRNTP